jgi:hypothetical protein
MIIPKMLAAVAMLLLVQADISGRWQTTTVANGPWIIELQVNGNKVAGSIRQGADGTPVPIYFGSVEGNAITFKVTSPDGDRIITFNGKITRTEIGFGRQVEVRPGGARGDTGIFGGNAVLNFSARRMN